MGGIRLRRLKVNGQPGAALLDPDGRTVGVLSVDIVEGKVQTLRSVVNPEKIDHLGPVGDTRELIRRMRQAR